jgi:hypothetical protein
MITLEAIKALSWQDNSRVSEGEGRHQIITVEVYPGRHVGQRFYIIRRGYGKISKALSPERALHYVRQRRSVR